MGFKGASRTEGLVPEPLEDAMASARRVAAANELTLDEGASSGDSLTFKKSIKLWSWGSTIVMDFEAVGPSETRLSISTKETFALTDWGRGRRLAHKILDGLSARRV